MENRGPQVIATGISMVVLCTLAVALRFLSRALSQTAGIWWDDWAALAALPFTIGIAAVSFYWVSIGLGQHEDRISTPVSKSLIALYAFNYLFNTALALVKASVLLFYSRIFRVVRWFSILLWIVGGLVIGWWIAINFSATFNCVPVDKFWKPKLSGTCIDTYDGFLGTAIPNFVTDVFLLLLPLPMLWRLQISWRSKIGLLLVFLCGYCVVVVSITRLVVLVNLGESLHKDLTWNIVTTHICTILEPSIALISICLPSIYHLGKRIGGLMSSQHEDPSRLLNGSYGFFRRLTGKGTDTSEVHDEAFLELKDVQPHAITSGERLFDNSASTEYHANAFLDHDQRSGGSIQGGQDLEAQEQGIYVRNTIDVGRL